ncbi:hypothetical protein AMTRI_Chr12g271310 [Amborella trichopoda]
MSQSSTFLHEHQNWNSFITTNTKKCSSFFSRENQRLFLFLYNFHVYQFESLFVFLRKQFFHLRSISFGSFLERTHFYGKIENFVVSMRNHSQNILWLFKDLFMHYVRYKGKSIMASRGTYLLMNKWKSHLVNFWQFRFYFWSQPGRIHINELSNHSFYFPGYLSGLRLNPSMVRSEMLENSFMIDAVIKIIK